MIIKIKNEYNLNIAYTFNRKEQKKHGEKGSLVGKKIQKKKIIILDDVITSGTAIRDSIQIIEKKEAEVSSIFVLLDRQEKGNRNLHSIHYFENRKNYKIISIITIEDLISYLLKHGNLKKHIPALIKYREKYGILQS